MRWPGSGSCRHRPRPPGARRWTPAARCCGGRPCCSLLAALVVAVPVLIAAGTEEPSRVRFQPRKNTEPLSVGACAHNDREWPHQDLRNVPCDSPDAQYLVTEQHNGYCADGDYYAYLQYSANGATPLCLHPVRD
ncbi:hypothetical protein ACFQ3Z_21445 [Streptomyces nogalater]